MLPYAFKLRPLLRTHITEESFWVVRDTITIVGVPIEEIMAATGFRISLSMWSGSYTV